MLPIITVMPAASAIALTLSALRMPPVFMSLTTNMSHASALAQASASRGPRTLSSSAMGTSTWARTKRAASRSSMRTGCSANSMRWRSSSLMARTAVLASHQPWLASTVMRASGPAASRTAATRCSSRSGASPTLILKMWMPSAFIARVLAARVSGSSQPKATTSCRAGRRAAADEVVERPPQRLALEVPERHLDARPAPPGCRPCTARGPRRGVMRLDVEGVPADDRRRKVLTDHVLHRPQRLAGELVGRARLADSR